MAVMRRFARLWLISKDAYIRGKRQIPRQIHKALLSSLRGKKLHPLPIIDYSAHTLSDEHVSGP